MNALAIAKKRDYVLQGNDVSRSIYSCSILARKVISFASTLVQVGIRTLDSDENFEIKTWSARFSISDFIKKFEITDSGENYQVIRKAIEECQSVKITLEKGKGFKSYNWFYSVEFSPEKDFVEMTFSPDVGAAIYNLKNGYIAMRFSVIKDFKSLYSFRYYEIANSYMGNKGKNGNKKGCWFFEYDVQTLKQILGIKKNAYESRMNNFIAWVIKKPLDELNKINNDFKIEFKKILENRKTVGFRFECTELSKQLKITKTDSPEEKQEKLEINEDWAKEPLWARMQEKYPEVWAEYFDQEKHSGFFVFDEVAKNATYERMLSEGFEI